MKIFFIGERRDSASKEVNLKIIKILENLGHIIDKSQVNASHQYDFENFEEAHKRNTQSIKKCDVLVAEISAISGGIGFLIATALNENKPVLALLNKKSSKKASITLKGATNKLFTLIVYEESDLEKNIKEFLTKVKTSLDTKFILIISPEIDRYLEWTSTAKRMHKAQIVRQAVEEMIDRDRDYKLHLTKN